ncbi:hypothetical protein HYE59_02005 [Aggregatibacter actinomycetemcomitans]|uniref:hypothetical protein n=1 Tax=Aggregatibacter actinomycetemcomitans TaxID=714 RepID=UPI00197BF7C3|nr:hypothetical protein [Aggregatibacter actinomycetemcomitans]MBN6076342.1 hypothetical protein [Aggregatibacter actinomycetemcomitans]
MQANKGFYVVITVVAIACGLMLWFLFSAPATPQPSTKDILNPLFIRLRKK